MKHLIKATTDSEVVFKDYDVVYFQQNSDKSYVMKNYDNPFIKIFTSSSYHDTAIIPLIARKYGNIPGDITWSTNLESGTATIQNGFLRFQKHYTGTFTLTATAGGKTATKNVSVDCVEIPTSYTYSVSDVSSPTVNFDETSTTITFKYNVIPVYALSGKTGTTITTDVSKKVTFPTYDVDYTTNEEMVDLNLPDGLKWSKCSIGAKNEYEHGLFFQWGSVDGTTGYPSTKGITGTFVYNNINVDWTVKQKNSQRDYSWSTTPYCTNSDPKFSKYLGSTDSSYKDPSATDEDALKTTLDSIDDAAVQHLGNGKRMPTTEECLTLKTNTYWQWINANTEVVVKVINDDGTITTKTVKYPAGYFVYKVNDNAHKGKMNTADISALYDYNYHPAVEGKDAVGVEDEDGYEPAVEASPEKEADVHIFLPASGNANGTGVNDRGSNGYYWSSSLNASYPYDGRYLYFRSGYIYPQGDRNRYDGFCVRAVSEN